MLRNISDHDFMVKQVSRESDVGGLQQAQQISVEKESSTNSQNPN